MELIEAELPLEITHYALVPDSGGAGRQRGGLAFSREYRLTADDAVFTLRSDRRDHPPYGIAGGLPGSPSKNLLTRGGKTEILPTMPMKAITLKKGDVFHHISAGGGGYGDPYLRAAELVLADTVVVMAPRPGRIRDQVPIALSRPRDATEAATARLAHQLKSLI